MAAKTRKTKKASAPRAKTTGTKPSAAKTTRRPTKRKRPRPAPTPKPKPTPTPAPTGAAKVLVVNMIPKSLSGESNQDSEPTLAVNPANPLQIAATAFTPDPSEGSTAPIFVSNDGGATWDLNFIVPSREITGDITVAFGGTSNKLYAGILRFPAPPNQTLLNILRTDDFQSATAMKVLVKRLGVDQPYVQAATVPDGSGKGRDRVYVGHNDFGASDGQTTTIEQSLNAGIATPTFTPVRLEQRSTASQDGPQTRPAIHGDGTVYAAYYGWRAQSGDWRANTLVVTADVVVVRDDDWGSGDSPFRALVDPDDQLPGLRVVQGVAFPFHNTGRGVPGQQRLGGDIAIAVDPTDSRRVYLAYAHNDPATATYSAHLRRSTDKGLTWSTDLLPALPMAINGALAVNSKGVVGLLYQQLTGTGAAQRWITHLRRSADGANWDDLVLATVPANTPSVFPPVGFDPYLGDYVHLQAVGETFYGVFSANNTPDKANFPNDVVYLRNADFETRTLLAINNSTHVNASIDPFFFKTLS